MTTASRELAGQQAAQRAAARRDDQRRFCRERHEKADHCAEIGITHFIDDRLDILGHLRPMVPNRFLFGEQPRLDRIPDWVSHVPDWPAAVESVLLTPWAAPSA